MLPNRITIHCSDSENGKAWPIASIRKMHIEERGFSDVGYHLAIQPDGEVERGRALNEKGAHVQMENDGNVGICLIGREKFTKAQFIALRYQLDSIIQVYGIKPWDIFGHVEFKSGQLQGKTCPNMSMKRILAWYIGHFEEAIKPYLILEAT